MAVLRQDCQLGEAQAQRHNVKRYRYHDANAECPETGACEELAEAVSLGAHAHLRGNQEYIKNDHADRFALHSANGGLGWPAVVQEQIWRVLINFLFVHMLI